MAGYGVSTTDAGDEDARRERRRGRRGRAAADADGRRSRRSWSASSAALPETPAGSSQESAYIGESGVVGVSRRSERGRRFSLVPEGPQPSDDARMTDEAAAAFDERDAGAQDEEARRRMRFAQDYELSPRGISGSTSRRQAVSDGLRLIPEAIGGAVLSALSRVHARGVLVMAAVAIVVLMLYGPARDLYLANRQLDTLQQTYDALLEENDSIRDELELLQTREGIENEARARGYVEVGETKVIVEGLPEDQVVDGAAAAVAELELPDTRPWYTVVLDALFGYDPEA